MQTEKLLEELETVYSKMVHGYDQQLLGEAIDKIKTSLSQQGAIEGSDKGAFEEWRDKIRTTYEPESWEVWNAACSYKNSTIHDLQSKLEAQEKVMGEMAEALFTCVAKLEEPMNTLTRKAVLQLATNALTQYNKIKK